METLEICCDASLKTFQTINGERIFTCSGAICINTGVERYQISQDSTNNRGELLGVYLAIKLAEEMINTYPNRFSSIVIYSDSQFAIFGLRDWMKNWIKHTDSNGTMYGSSNKPVKNQNMFKMIITYCVLNKLVVRLLHQKGHINTSSPKALVEANKVFHRSNGFFLKPEDIFKISFYNDIVDKNSRNMLENINPDSFPIIHYNDDGVRMCRYVIPDEYINYIK